MTDVTDSWQKSSPSAGLPKGVIRGCTNCQDCVKVTARWRPEESCRPVLNDAPVFCPTEEEFKDSLKYVASIREEAENYGICRIIPPASWRPPGLLEDENIWQDTKFSTRIQQIELLSNLHLKEKQPSLNEKMETEVSKVSASMKFQYSSKGVANSKEDNSGLLTIGFEDGPELTLNSFKNYADDFKRQYFCKNDCVMSPKCEASTADIEGEYWRIIENPSEEIEVLYGSNIGCRTLGSGFPIKSNPANMAEYSEYLDSEWNLNNIPKLFGSLLSFGCNNTNEILHPQLFIGMCFASQCWRTEEHHLYSLCYMHLGEPTVWYGVPGRYYFKFVEVLKKKFPELSRQPKLFHNLVSQISPSTLIAEGIPVYSCVQNPSEFVLVFPGAYHSRFSCGFNCLEWSHFAPFDWLPHGQNIVELYSEYCFKTSISHNKLLLGATMEAVNAVYESLALGNETSNFQLWRSIGRKDGILTKLLKSCVKSEAIRREHLCNPNQSTVLDDFDYVTKMECTTCFYDLYLSLVGCPCSPNKYHCLRHAKELCSCAWSERYFIFRFGINELNLLVEALEGDVKAVYSWAMRKAGLNILPKSNGSNNTLARASHKDSAPNKAMENMVNKIAPIVVILSDDEN